jgi:hypothetical protein
MVSLDSDVNIDISTSCTKEQAVMKLLGWSQGIFTSTKMYISIDGLWLDQLPSISHHNLNLEDQLKQLHERARQEYLCAFPPEAFTSEFDPEKHISSNDVYETLIKKQENLESVKVLIARARSYAMNIDEEIDKGEQSLLRTDTQATVQNGVLHITLRSLERWKNEFYDKKADGGVALVASNFNLDDSDLMAQLSKSVPENAKQVGQADLSLYITLAITVEAIAEKLGPPYCDKNETPVITQIAELIASKYQSKDGRSLIRGQGLEMIRKRLTLAMKLKSKQPEQT